MAPAAAISSPGIGEPSGSNALSIDDSRRSWYSPRIFIKRRASRREIVIRPRCASGLGIAPDPLNRDQGVSLEVFLADIHDEFAKLNTASSRLYLEKPMKLDRDLNTAKA